MGGQLFLFGNLCKMGNLARLFPGIVMECNVLSSGYLASGRMRFRPSGEIDPSHQEYEPAYTVRRFVES
jgi:hypothetical protein